MKLWSHNSSGTTELKQSWTHQFQRAAILQYHRCPCWVTDQVSETVGLHRCCDISCPRLGLLLLRRASAVPRIGLLRLPKLSDMLFLLRTTSLASGRVNHRLTEPLLELLSTACNFFHASTIFHMDLCCHNLFGENVLCFFLSGCCLTKLAPQPSQNWKC
jgi:hypothetical protein